MALIKKWPYTLAAATLVVALVLIVIGQLQVNAADDFNQAQASKEATLPPVESSSLVTSPTSSPVVIPSTVTPTTQQTLESTVAAVTPEPVTDNPIKEVAPAAPESLTLVTTSADLNLTVKVDAMPYNDKLEAPICAHDSDPECPEKAYWVQDTMGVAPASSTDNSTYIVGHSWTQSPRVFNQLSDYAMAHYETESDPNGPPGAVRPKVTSVASVWDHTGETQTIETWKVPGLIDATVTIGTANGTLTYQVTTAFVAKKVDVGNIWQFQRGDKNTTTIETCGIIASTAVDSEYGVVVQAKLVAAEPKV